MRWWNTVKDDGSNEWVFESLEDMSEVGAVDARVFWLALYLSPTMWTLLLLVALLKLNLMGCIIIAVAIVLSGANIYGYTKCSKDAEKKIAELSGQASVISQLAGSSSSLVSTLGTSAFSKAMSMFGGSAGSVPNDTKV